MCPFFDWIYKYFAYGLGLPGDEPMCAIIEPLCIAKKATVIQAATCIISTTASRAKGKGI